MLIGLITKKTAASDCEVMRISVLELREKDE